MAAALFAIKLLGGGQGFGAQLEASISIEVSWIRSPRAILTTTRLVVLRPSWEAGLKSDPRQSKFSRRSASVPCGFLLRRPPALAPSTDPFSAIGAGSLACLLAPPGTPPRASSPPARPVRTNLQISATGCQCPESEIRLLYFGAQRCRIWRSDEEPMLIHREEERLQRQRRSARTRRADGGCWLRAPRRPGAYPGLPIDSTFTLRPATSIGDSDRISDSGH